MSGGGDWGAEVQAALLVELLRGVEVELIAGKGMAHAFVGDVAERVIFPGVRCCKKHGSIAANKNIFLGFALRSWLGSRRQVLRCVIWGRFRIAWPAGIRCGFRFPVVHLLFGWGSFFYVVGKERPVSSPAEKREKRSRKPTIAVMIMNAIRMCSREMGVVETEAWDASNIF